LNDLTKLIPGLGANKHDDFAWIYALYKLGQTVATGIDPRKVQQDILDHIVSGLEAGSGSIALIVEGTTDVLEIVAGTDLPPGTVGSRLAPGVGVFGHVLATGQPLLINGGVAETHLPVRTNQRRERSTDSAMCWPLRVNDRIIGTLAVNRAAGVPRYSVADLDRGQIVTSLLALVMANHRMHVERESRISELSLLNAEMLRINALLEEAQDQIIQSEKLASIGQIAAGVAHEINNPVAFVLSNLFTLETYLSGLVKLIEHPAENGDARTSGSSSVQPGLDVQFLRDDGIALLRESREGLLRVKRIVEDLKDFSRGGADETWETVDLHKALDRTLNMVRNEIKYKARIDTHYGELPHVECLPSRINQVFLNLLVNAGQAIDANGIVTISSGVDGREVWFRFEDNGCGIRKEHLNRIFEPFFTTKPVGQGTGLGLSVSYSIVRKHGGRIEVDSDIGRGTRFTIHLPIHQTLAGALPHAAEAGVAANAA
jgi:two-component system, NtrC family, sensor kinase